MAHAARLQAALGAAFLFAVCLGLCGPAAAQIESTAAAMTAAALPASTGHQRWAVAMQYQQRYPNGPGIEMMPARMQQPGLAHAAQEAEESRLTIEFRPRSATAELRDWGALRMQLSSSGTLSMRPRRGGMQMSWRATF